MFCSLKKYFKNESIIKKKVQLKITKFELKHQFYINVQKNQGKVISADLQLTYYCIFFHLQRHLMCFIMLSGPAVRNMIVVNENAVRLPARHDTRD